MLADMQAHPRRFPSVSWTIQDGKMCFSFAGGSAKRPLMHGFSNVEARKKWVAEHNIDKQIVAGWLDMFGYDIPAEEGADWARYLNEEMLRGVRELPFLAPLATVPMQSGRHAAAVLR